MVLGERASIREEIMTDVRYDKRVAVTVTWYISNMDSHFFFFFFFFFHTSCA
jgi:hypothetical protein